MIYPMAALVLLTFIVALMMFKARITALKSRQVPISYFKTYDTPASELPERMVLTQRCYNNLLELPPLFYAACLAVMVTQLTGPLLVTLAWCYVACRTIQAGIHLMGNRIRWRMRFFLLGNIFLLAMWTVMVAALLARG